MLILKKSLWSWIIYHLKIEKLQIKRIITYMKAQIWGHHWLYLWCLPTSILNSYSPPLQLYTVLLGHLEPTAFSHLHRPLFRKTESSVAIGCWKNMLGLSMFLVPDAHDIKFCIFLDLSSCFFEVTLWNVNEAADD